MLGLVLRETFLLPWECYINVGNQNSSNIHIGSWMLVQMEIAKAYYYLLLLLLNIACGKKKSNKSNMFS